ncbi:MAG: hypothetical protein H7Y88_01850 [Phycisphaerales bacterium]|nr:hypothetical protein [Phycisphaerales bacterium]
MSFRDDTSPSPFEIPADRLCDAAEAALMAAVDIAEYTGNPWPYPADLMGTSMQPACLESFTRSEIEQACRFLVRLGVLEARGSTKAT